MLIVPGVCVIHRACRVLQLEDRFIAGRLASGPSWPQRITRLVVKQVLVKFQHPSSLAPRSC
jgi:hypothetical protein